MVGSPYINPERELPYTITFENVSTASAAAQEVIVIDTLDANVYDFSTFRFSGYGWDTLSFIANAEYSDDGLIGFSDIIDVRPMHPNYVKVDATFNSINGIAQWKFTTLDTNTLQLTSDVFEGFLPPNNTSPEGEGFITFSVSLKPGLSEGTPIRNKANIIFDVNDPITTPTWENLFDITPPESEVFCYACDSE